MSFEIERKFLVRGHDWQKLATTPIPIRQAYLASNGKTSIRIRIKGDSAATLRPCAVPNQTVTLAPR